MPPAVMALLQLGSGASLVAVVRVGLSPHSAQQVRHPGGEVPGLDGDDEVALKHRVVSPSGDLPRTCQLGETVVVHHQDQLVAVRVIPSGIRPPVRPPMAPPVSPCVRRAAQALAVTSADHRRQAAP